MVLNLREYYAEHPLMISSPFGGVTGFNETLVAEVFGKLGVDCGGHRVLDIGCGRGFIGEYVRARGGRYTGVDILASGHGFPLAVGVADALPFAAGSFDAVFCIDAFEHFPWPGRAAAEIRRVLAPGGFVFLSVPNYGNVAGIVKAWCERFGHYGPNTWAPFRNWQPQELEHRVTARKVRRIFLDAGFTRTAFVAHPAEAGLGIFPWMDHPKMPESVKFRLQRLFLKTGPAIVRAWPNASLHHFWKIA